MAQDPLIRDLNRALSTLGKLRGLISTEVQRLPAPQTLKAGLQEIDKLASRTEREIEAAITKWGLPD